MVRVGKGEYMEDCNEIKVDSIPPCFTSDTQACNASPIQVYLARLHASQGMVPDIPHLPALTSAPPCPALPCPAPSRPVSLGPHLVISEDAGAVRHGGQLRARLEPHRIH